MTTALAAKKEMTIPLLLTKLHHPLSRPNLVARPGLVERLNEGLHHRRKLTLVTAPAGFGKTTLVTEWLRQLDLPFAWLCLDEGDNDPARLLGLIVAALQTVDHRVGLTVQSILQSRQLTSATSGQLQESDGQWVQAAMTALINEMVILSTSMLLILDDYHVINQKQVHEGIQFLLEHQPAQVHLVLVTRENPPFPLSRMRVRTELTEIRERDLRFSESEAAAFFTRTMGLDLAAEAVATLNARTEGWIAGLQMGALSLQGLDAARTAELIATFSGTHHYVIDFFAEEVLRRQPETMQGFMCRTAILDRMCASLCDAVTGREDSQAILARLDQNNLFLVALDDRRGWYRYHHLFRDFLRTRLGSDRQIPLHRQAAQWYEAHGLIEQAVDHALAAGDMGEAERVIGLACRQAIEEGHLASMLRWLEGLPDERVRASRELAIYKGWALCLTGQRKTAESYAASAEGSLAADTPPTHLVELLTLRGYLAVQRGDNANALLLAKQALAKMDPADPRYQSAFRNAALLALGHAQREIGDTEAAIDAFRQAASSALAHRDGLPTMGALEELSLLLYRHGRRQEAAALCRQAIARCLHASGGPLPASGLAYIVLAMMEYEADELEAAFDHVRRGLELCQQLIMPAVTLRGKLLLARLQQAVGQDQLASDTIDEARQIAGRMEYPRFVRLVAATGAAIHLLQGRVGPVARWAEAFGFHPTDTPHAAREEEYLVYARLLLAQERIQEAELVLENLAHSTRERGRFGSLISIHVFQAVAKLAQGQASEAHDFLQQALGLAAPRGYYRAFLEAGSAIADPLPTLRPAAPEMVDAIMKQITGRVPPPAKLAFPLVEPLSPRELEVLRLVAEGLSNREAAESLFVTEGTVKKHLSHVYGKLGVKNRTQALARAKEIGLLE